MDHPREDATYRRSYPCTRFFTGRVQRNPADGGRWRPPQNRDQHVTRRSAYGTPGERRPGMTPVGPGWHPEAVANDDLDTLLAEQRAYYRARADEYDATYPLDEGHDADARQQFVAALEAHAPFGRVLELACGTGQWTVELARHASTVTAVDSSPEALAICRQRVNVPHVSLVQADLFAWWPQQRYDLVFFAAWLSHVPPQRFDAFWELVADCLSPGGRVFVIDELSAGSTVELAQLRGEPAPAVQRRLTTGESYRAVKVYYEPDDLRARLTALGWDSEAREVGWRYYWAIASKAGPTDAASAGRPVAVR